MSVEEQREEFIQKALKSGFTSFDKCGKCGSVRHCFHSVLDLSSTCVVCAAEEKYPDPPPKPKLDLDDFSRV